MLEVISMEIHVQVFRIQLYKDYPVHPFTEKGVFKSIVLPLMYSGNHVTI